MKHLVPILFVLLVAASTIVRAAPVSYNTTTLLQLNGKGLEGVVYAPDGNIYYTLSDDHAIYKFVKGGPSVLIAGTAGSSGFSGDGGQATAAKLSHPMSPSFHANGDLYFADQGNGRIRKIDATTKVITTVAGNGSDCSYGAAIEEGGLATSACLSGVRGVYVKGNELYIADTDHNRIRKVKSGNITTIVGGFSGSYQTMDNVPVYKSLIDMDAFTICDNGDVYISNAGASGSYYIRKVSNGMITHFLGSNTTSGYTKPGPVDKVLIKRPKQLACGGDSELFFSDMDANNVTNIYRVRNGNVSLIINGTYSEGFIPGVSKANEIGIPFISFEVGAVKNAVWAIKDTLFLLTKNNVTKIDLETFVASTYVGSAGGEPCDNNKVASTCSVSDYSIGSMRVHNNDLYVAIGQPGEKQALYSVSHFYWNNPPHLSRLCVCIKDYKFVVVDGWAKTWDELPIESTSKVSFADNDVFYNYNNRLVKVSLDGHVSVIAGRMDMMDGDNALETKLDKPYAIDFDSNGDMYIASSSMIIKYDHITQRVNVVAGSPLGITGYINDVNAVGAKLGNPAGLAVTPNGKKVFISDKDNSVIRVAKIDGLISTVIGDSSHSSFQNGVGSKGYVNQPSLITRNHVTGTILVSDYSNGMIRLITPFCENNNTVYNATYEVCVPRTACKYGYYYTIEKDTCQAIRCNGKIFNDNNVCSSQGSCIADDKCNCNAGYSGDNCENIIKLSVPANVTITNVTSNSFVVSWNAVNLADWYAIVLKGPTRIQKSTGATFILISSLDESTQYNVTVVAVSSISGSDYSAPITVMTKTMGCNGIAPSAENVCSAHGSCVAYDKCNCTEGYSGDYCETVIKLAKPTGVTTKNITSDSFIISWNGVNLANYYYVIGVSDGSSKIEKTTSETFIMISSLKEATRYNVTLKAKNLISESYLVTVTVMTIPSPTVVATPGEEIPISISITTKVTIPFNGRIAMRLPSQFMIASDFRRSLKSYDFVLIDTVTGDEISLSNITVVGQNISATVTDGAPIGSYVLKFNVMVESGASVTNPSDLTGSIVIQSASGVQLETIAVTLPEIQFVYPSPSPSPSPHPSPSPIASNSNGNHPTQTSQSNKPIDSKGNTITGGQSSVGMRNDQEGPNLLFLLLLLLLIPIILVAGIVPVVVYVLKKKHVVKDVELKTTV